jgi:hypothetical protein
MTVALGAQTESLAALSRTLVGLDRVVEVDPVDVAAAAERRSGAISD